MYGICPSLDRHKEAWVVGRKRLSDLIPGDRRMSFSLFDVLFLLFKEDGQVEETKSELYWHKTEYQATKQAGDINWGSRLWGEKSKNKGEIKLRTNRWPYNWKRQNAQYTSIQLHIKYMWHRKQVGKSQRQWVQTVQCVGIHVRMYILCVYSVYEYVCGYACIFIFIIHTANLYKWICEYLHGGIFECK